MTYSTEDMRDAEWDHEWEPDPDLEIPEREEPLKRPVVDASYTIRTPEGRTVEVIVTDITEDEVGFRLLAVRHGVPFRCPVDDFMGMAL